MRMHFLGRNVKSRNILWVKRKSIMKIYWAAITNIIFSLRYLKLAIALGDM